MPSSRRPGLRSVSVVGATGERGSPSRGDPSTIGDERSNDDARAHGSAARTPRSFVVGAVRLLIAAVSLVALTVLAVAEPPASGVAALSLGLLVIAAEVDRRRWRLPDALLGFAALPVGALAIVAGLTGRWDVVVAVLIGAVFAAGPIGALHAVSPAAMGFGDVKAAAVLGAALGLVEPRLAVATLAVASLSAFVVARATRRRRIPFGPFLVLAGVAVAVVWVVAGPEGSRW